MKKFRIFQQFDLVVQSLLLIGVSIPLILAPAAPGFLMWSMLLLLPFGLWQLISALILGFRDEFRHLYLLTATAFCGLFFTGAFLYGRASKWLDVMPWPGDNIGKYFFIAFLVVSYLAGLFYFTYSFRYYWNGANNGER